MWILRLFAVIAILASSALAVEPAPTDDSEMCTQCLSVVGAWQAKWTNSTAIGDILINLEEECKANHHGLEKDLCDKLAEFWITIPPQIIEGMDNLAWDIPIATCAIGRKCKTPCCAEDSIEQVHLSLTSDRSEMGVSWVTLHNGDTFVQYSTTSDFAEMLEVEGRISTYSSAGWEGIVHKAVMTRLAPATEYYYRVGGGDRWSDTLGPFKTFDPEQSQAKFVVIADMGFGENSDNTIARITELIDAGEVDVVVHSGDIGYADGYEVHWDTFFNKIQPIASRVPYHVTPGNHEFWFNFAAYKERFFLPGSAADEHKEDGEGNRKNMYYSWEYGIVHFAAMNSESAVDTPEFKRPMLDFFERDLSNVDRAKTPFVIAHFHRPLYCSNDKQCTKTVDDPNILVRQAEELFYQHQVDMIFTGHVHDYERMGAIYKAESVATPTDGSYGAPVYILQGSSGNREGNKSSWPADDDLPDWSLAHSGEIGYGVLTSTAAQGGATLKWAFYRSEDNELLDTATYTAVEY